MCNVWHTIRCGVRWNPAEKFALACRAIDLKNVKRIDISIDPFHTSNASIRRFWHSISVPRVLASNPKMKVVSKVRRDGKPPFFIVYTGDNREIVFNTGRMHVTDIIMTFNRLLGNLELGKAGVRPT